MTFGTLSNIDGSSTIYPVCKCGHMLACTYLLMYAIPILWFLFRHFDIVLNFHYVYYSLNLSSELVSFVGSLDPKFDDKTRRTKQNSTENNPELAPIQWRKISTGKVIHFHQDEPPAWSIYSYRYPSIAFNAMNNLACINRKKFIFIKLINDAKLLNSMRNRSAKFLLIILNVLQSYKI